jgi:predicted RNA binding protein YcfA (HicA-like mRNA interferase family)
MSNPTGRRKLVARLRRLGFVGPYTGGSHEFMTRGSVRLILPNPHRADISDALLQRVLRQAGITRDEWEESR